jgi:hypothetical protein
MSKLHSLIVESKWYKKYPAVSWSLVGFVSGCAMSSVFYFLFFPTSAALIKPLRESSLNGSAQYKFIDPLLGVSGTGATTAPEYSPLESLLRTYISDQIEQGNLSSASVIVSDINQAQGFVINPDENYSPASLLKVPTMIAYYKLAERDTSLVSILTYKNTISLQYNLKKVVPIALKNLLSI